MTKEEMHQVAQCVAALCRAINSKGKVFEKVYPDDDRVTCITVPLQGKRGMFSIGDSNIVYFMKYIANHFTYHFGCLQQITDYIDTEECKALYELELLAGGIDV